MDNENCEWVMYKFLDCCMNKVLCCGSDIEEKYLYVCVRFGCC